MTFGMRVEKRDRDEFQALKSVLKNDVAATEAARLKFKELLQELRAMANTKAS